MHNVNHKSPDAYFSSLEGRYKSYLLRKIKTYLDNAGYKGLAFMYMISTKGMLYGTYRDTPLFKDIINSYEGAYIFDRRTAVAQAMETAGKLRSEATGKQGFGNMDFVPKDDNRLSHEFWANSLKSIGQEKVGYVPDPKDILHSGVRQNDFVVKFLVRYHTLKNLINEFGKRFTTEEIDRRTKASTAVEAPLRQNEAAETIGREHYPELFITDYDPARAEMQDGQELDMGLEKHEWQGTQYQLAELYIELERKGWIKKKEVKTIQASFTNSNTLQQILKPAYDLNEPTYSNVYREGYKPMFEGMKQNKKIKR